MRSLKTVVGAITALLLLALIVSVQGDTFRSAHDLRTFLASFTDRAFSYGELVRLRTEAEALRAERATLLEAGIPPFSAELMKVPIYSRYPYGTEGLLMIAGGSDTGVREGAPVLATPGTLLGKVTRVRRARSEIITIFNPAWRSSVRFEGSGTKALLEGGASPLLTLIPRAARPVPHTRVVNVDPAFPFGLFLGAAGGAEGSGVEPWYEAPLETPYRESDLAEVLVLVNFP